MCEIENLLNQMAKQLDIELSDNADELRKNIRRKFLEQGLDDAIMTSRMTFSEEDRRQFLNNLDAELFPL